MKLEQARTFALSLPGSNEEPHFHFSSFRVCGRIYATVPPEGTILHIFVPEEHRERALVLEPETTEKLFWGAKAIGVRVHLPKARKTFVEELLRNAWAHKSAKGPAKPRKPRSKRGA